MNKRLNMFNYKYHFTVHVSLFVGALLFIDVSLLVGVFLVFPAFSTCVESHFKSYLNFQSRNFFCLFSSTAEGGNSSDNRKRTQMTAGSEKGNSSTVSIYGNAYFQRNDIS